MQYAFLNTEAFPFLENVQQSFEAFRQFYSEMPVDPHLNQGEGERTRRYARMGINPRSLELFLFPHDAFYQSKTYDVLYGDIHRNFPPITEEIAQNQFFQNLLRENFLRFSVPQEARKEMYEISVHMIRIAATSSSKKGRPAPEGIHRDGYHYAAIHLMARQNLEGAENRIHDLQKRVVERRTFLKPMDSCLFDDRTIFHSVQPFKAIQPDRTAYRDMLILLYQPISESPQRAAVPRRLN